MTATHSRKSVRPVDVGKNHCRPSGTAKTKAVPPNYRMEDFV